MYVSSQLLSQYGKSHKINGVPFKELLDLMFVNNVNNFINKKLDRFEIRNKRVHAIIIFSAVSDAGMIFGANRG